MISLKSKIQFRFKLINYQNFATMYPTKIQNHNHNFDQNSHLAEHPKIFLMEIFFNLIGRNHLHIVSVRIDNRHCVYVVHPLVSDISGSKRNLRANQEISASNMIQSNLPGRQRGETSEILIRIMKKINWKIINLKRINQINDYSMKN